MPKNSVTALPSSPQPASKDKLPSTADLETGVSRAHAAVRLLEAVRNGDLDPVATWREGDDPEDFKEWWEDIAVVAAAEGLADAKRSLYEVLLAVREAGA